MSLPSHLTIISDCAINERTPISTGMPFPRGHLTRASDLSLHHPSGEFLPVQGTALERWSDGSIRWILLDFVLPSLHAGENTLLVTTQPRSDVAGSDIQLEYADRGYLVKTGRAIFSLNTRKFSMLEQIQIGHRQLLPAIGPALVLKARDGQRWMPTIDQHRVLAGGPVRASIEFDGHFEECPSAAFVARFCFFADTALVRFTFTLHNRRRAAHRGGLWDLGDPNSLYFEELSGQFELAGVAPASISWTEDAFSQKSPAMTTTQQPWLLFQASSGGENWHNRNHINYRGEIPLSFRGYEISFGETRQRGLRASPTVRLSREDTALTVVVPEFWQQFPKTLQFHDGKLCIALFPSNTGSLHELQGGEKKAHTLWFHASDGQIELPSSLQFVHQPPRIILAKQQIADADAFAYFVADPSDDNPADLCLKEILNAVISPETGLESRREIIDEYGWRHYGEIYADHEALHYRGIPPVISHYNNQYDVLYGLLLNYCRTGNGQFFRLAEPLARHIIDIDIYDTDEDKSAYSGGMFWHTDHYLSAETCTHRTYSKRNANGRRAYGGGPASQHNYTTGLLYYYYLTGETRARDAVIGLADWVLHMDDGNRNILAIIHSAPTGHASSTFDFHGPGRGAGWSINSLLDGWKLTGRRTYLLKAEELIRRCVNPNDDIGAYDLINAELRWSYTIFLTNLERYLRVKDEAGERDYMVGYARASLLHYATWMLEHEFPYFDRSETLEFPTEAWAGQEIRKANVLRLAAGYASDVLQKKLLEKANLLAARARRDVMRFETRFVARSLAIWMNEGPKDVYFTRYGAKNAGPLTEKFAFDAPRPFTGQRRLVVNELKTASGLVRAVKNVLKPRQWEAMAHLKGSKRP